MAASADNQSDPVVPVAPEELQYARCDLSDIVMNPQPRMTPYGEQDDNGVDLSLIRANLRLSPLERALANYRGARQLLELRRHRHAG
jgi:hypothetical protein